MCAPVKNSFKSSWLRFASSHNARFQYFPASPPRLQRQPERVHVLLHQADIFAAGMTGARSFVPLRIVVAPSSFVTRRGITPE